MSIRSALLLAGAVALLGVGSANAENPAMKQCADKWQAAKAANQTGGLTYLQFSSKCRAELKAGAAAAAPAAPAAAPAAASPLRRPPRPPRQRAPARPAAAPAATGPVVFPTAIIPPTRASRPARRACTPASISTRPTRRRAATAA